jgi:hypothetical protein
MSGPPERTIPSASISAGGRVRRDDLGVDAHVAERPPFEVGELAVEVDDDDPGHGADWRLPHKKRLGTERSIVVVSHDKIVR